MASSKSFDRIALDTEIHHIVFYGAILVVTVFFLVKSFELRPATRLFPLIVFSIGFILLIFRLGSDLGTKFAPSLMEDLLPQPAETDDDELRTLKEMHGRDAEPVTIDRQVRMVGWVIVFTVTMYMIGILPAIPLLMFVFLLVESDIGVLKALVITAFVYGGVYALFIAILNVRMHEGLVPIL